MAKTLVIAEKPSVGRDLARVLTGPFEKHEGYLESETHVVTWAVGHLVQLAEPDEYDPKYKKWRMADLPIVPDRFKLIVRDERSRKQMSVVTSQLSRKDVEEVINACDAGREGELIFAYVFEKAGARKPGQAPVAVLDDQGRDRDALRDAARRRAEMHSLEDAARSRSEADWIVGMNATRAATIRLRSSFDGAVSLGRVQTPTLAIVARREEEIRAFKPEPYWLVDATFAAPPAEQNGNGERVYAGRYHAGSQATDLPTRRGGSMRSWTRSVAGTRPRRSPSSRSASRSSVRRCCTTSPRCSVRPTPRFGFSARRTLVGGAAPVRGAQGAHLPAHELPLPDHRHGARDRADRRAAGRPAGVREGVAGVRDRPRCAAARRASVDDAKVADHHAIIPTQSEHRVEKMGDDDRRVYDMVVRRFLAVFHPDAEFENTRVETTVATEHVFRTRGRLLLVPGWRGVYGELSEAEAREGREARDEDEGTEQLLPRLTQGEDVEVREVGSERKETKPPRRYSDASLLAAMETAGKMVEEDELREAMKDSGIGTPATRAAIIERLIDVGYIERDGRALVATEKGVSVVRLLGEHALTSPDLTGRWEHRLGRIERGEDSREGFMRDIAGFADSTVHELDDKLKDVRIPRAQLGPCPVCGHEITENRKGYSCWSRADPGCGFVIWKSKAGKQIPLAAARELIRTGYTEQPVTGFRGRSGRSFRARLALAQTEDGRWRVEFNEAWARDGAKPPDHESEPPAQAGEQPPAQEQGGDESEPRAA